jgi:D-glycero-alpha-D-manno-heptose-7-phosphate kinase
VITTRTPFRISFAGGGSDLPAFFEEEPGMVLSAAIDKYMYVTVKKAFGEFYRISYSQTEIRERIEDIEHPIVRECLNAVPSPQGLEIVSIADIPAQAGMGSSSSFTVGLLGALYAMVGQVSSAENLANKACEIEIRRLREPIGKQDQYIAAYGGMQFMQFLPNGDVYVDPVICSHETRAELNRRLLLFFTGATRETRTVLRRQNARTHLNRTNLRELCAISKEMRDILTAGTDLNAFGRLLHSAWTVKRSLEDTISNPEIDEYYDRAMKAGALGGKLLGAGGGGFLLFFCEPHCQMRLKRALDGLRQVPFGFEPQGSKVIYVGDEHWARHVSLSSAETA